MDSYRESVNKQYGEKDLDNRILEAIRNAGVDVRNLTPEDLSGFDQLHAGGNNSTRILAEMAGLTQGMQVLDVGCGIGGPSRTLAAEFGCFVTGVDLSVEFVKAAKMLTDIVGLKDKVTFQEGNALNLAFDDGSFDVVWTQSAIMNIQHIQGFIKEVHRVLRPDGFFVVEAVVKGHGTETRFPVLWADSPSVSYLTTSANLRWTITENGFEEMICRDVTHERIAIRQQAQSARVDQPHPLQQLFTLVQPRLAEKVKNVALGYEEGIYRGMHGVYKLCEKSSVR